MQFKWTSGKDKYNFYLTTLNTGVEGYRVDRKLSLWDFSRTKHKLTYFNFSKIYLPGT